MIMPNVFVVLNQKIEKYKIHDKKFISKAVGKKRYRE